MRVIYTIIIAAVLVVGGYWAYKNVYQSTMDGADNRAVASLDKEVQYFQTLKEKPPGAALAGESDYRAFAEAIHELAAISFGAFEPEGAGVVAHDVVVAGLDNPEIGARITELRLYGLDISALDDFENGRSARILERFDARNVNWFGLEIFTETGMDAYIGAIAGTVEGLSAGNEAGADVDLDELFVSSVDRYDLTAAQILMDGFTLHPLDSALVRDDGVEPGLAEMFQSIARWSRVFSVEAASFYDMSADLAIEQMGQNSIMKMVMPLTGYRDYRRGDTAVMVLADISYQMDMEISASQDAGTDAPLIPMSISGGIDRYVVSDLNLAKIYEYAARGEFPPVSDTDLISLGLWQIEGEHYEMGGQPFFSVGKTVADFSKFHWLAPTEIRVESKDIVYNIGGVMSYMSTIASASGAAPDDETNQLMADAVEILKKYDLAAPRMDFDISFRWNPDDGDGQTAFLWDVKDFAALEYKGAAQMPTFDALSSFDPAEGEKADWNGLLEIVREQAALRSLGLMIEDKGGLDKGYGLAVDFAKLVPEDPSDAVNVMLRNADPADLRISNAAMIRMMAPQMAQVLPAAKDYLVASADFIQKGGVLRAEANPPSPVTMEMIETQSAEFQTDPNRLVEMYGFSVTHEPAPETTSTN